MLPQQLSNLIPETEQKDIDAKDVNRILQAALKAYANDEIKLDALTGLAGWAKVMAANAGGKLKEASINKEKVRTKYFGQADI